MAFFSSAMNPVDRALKEQGCDEPSFGQKIWYALSDRFRGHSSESFSTMDANDPIGTQSSRPAPSVFQLLLVGSALITIVPTTILAWEVYDGAWDNAWREIGEKHQLLATTLASPISIYVDDHRDILGHIAVELAAMDSGASPAASKKRLLDSAFATLRGFRSLVVVDISGKTEILAHRNQYNISDDYIFKNEACFLQAAQDTRPAVSGLKSSPLTGQPSIIISHPVVSRKGKATSVVLAELRLDRIEELRSAVQFGEKGHSAIVDATGKVVAHGNKEWVREMKDLTHLSVVAKVMAGETGVTEFYSPFLKTDMVAGYTTVPDLGWGILVPQPRAEIEAQVWSLVSKHFFWAVVCTGFAMLLAVAFTRWITAPINQLATAAKVLKEDRFQGHVPRVPKGAPKEIHQLGSSFRELLENLQSSRGNVNTLNKQLRRRVEKSTRKLKRANANLADLAKSDHLTKLNNRMYFEYSLKTVLADRDRRGGPYALMTLDLDKFKVVNDTCGHLAGDELLKRLAALLRDMVRTNDTIARLGGDEFAVLLRNCSEAEARTVANNVRDAIADMRFKWEDNRFDITASIGLVMVTPGDGDLESVLHAADQCCMEAKNAGRDAVVVYQPDDTRKSSRLRESRWIARLTDALENDRFALFYQPIVPVNNPKRASHCEILLRLEGDDGDLLNPGLFLPPAERFQLMPQIDRWVTSKVIDWLATPQGRNFDAEVVLVNLSAQSLTDDRFADFVTEQFAQSGVDPARICFEVTETAAISSLSRAAKLMARLRELGCRFALDDFGSGMSSFDYLTDLPVQVLKIDGSYVERIVDSPAHCAIVRSINDIGHAMNMVTVAESVCDPKIMQQLKELGVNYAQGFAIGKPAPLFPNQSFVDQRATESVRL